MNLVKKFQAAIKKINGVHFDKYANLTRILMRNGYPTPDQIEQADDLVLDVRSCDCSDKDLSDYKMDTITFDSKTIFPSELDKLPEGFDIKKIMENGKNPGLGVKDLHKQGIDGSGISIAIIDKLLPEHTEYRDNVVRYEKIGSNEEKNGTMHGAAVASIAVGKTVGVAPKAKLYYFAARLSEGKGDKRHIVSKYYAKALDRIVEINKSLPDNEKIVVVSVSASPSESVDSELWAEALKRAKDNNIFVTTTDLIAEYGLFDNGLKREVLGNPDNPVSYSKPKWWNVTKAEEQQKVTLAFPMDHRTTASPTGDTDYTHYVSGGWSWMKPFEAALYALAKQTDRTITPEQFFEIGLQTGTYSKKAEAVIANPVALIEEVKERKRIRDLQKLKLLSRDM